jgi:L-ascorbate metabolism protein UlaG (beta-lactamase superfamily)
MSTRRRFLKRGLAAGMVLAAGASALLPRRANAYYAGPITDHFDGVQFFNPGGRAPKGLAQVARLYALESWTPWPRQLPSPLPADRPPPAVAATGSARIVLIGHASWLIQVGGRNILIDPVWADRVGPLPLVGPRRANPPGIAFDDLPPIHIVLVTHNHYDHLDLATLARLWQRHRPQIVTPLGNDTIMRSAAPDLEAKAVDWGQTVDLGTGLAVHSVPTQHWSARGARDRRHALWASFVIETPVGRIYAVGDSGFGDGSIFRDIGARFPGIRLALLPIGAYEPRWFMEGQHMNPADALAAFRLVGAAMALGHHWGTFQLTTEAHDQPPADLARALAAAGIPAERFRPMRPGEVWVG